MIASDSILNINNLSSLKNALEQRLVGERKRNFGKVKAGWGKYANEYHWDESQQASRMQDLVANGFIPGKTRILDLAAGHGQYLCYSSKFGYDCYGLEPEMENIL